MQCIQLLGSRKGNIVETHLGVGGWTMGAVLSGHNLVASEIQDRQMDYARDNLLNVNTIIQEVYHTRFRLPMSATFIRKTQRAPYEPNDPDNQYLPNPMLVEPDLVSGTRANWNKIFGKAEHLLVSKSLSSVYESDMHIGNGF